MDNIFPGVVYLSEEQYLEIKTNGHITVGDITLDYDPNVLYVTPDNIAELVRNHTLRLDQLALNLTNLNTRIDNILNNLDTNTIINNGGNLTAVGVKNTETNEFKTAESLIKATNIIIYEDDE